MSRYLVETPANACMPQYLADAAPQSAISKHIAHGCRYLVETPANICTPQYLADTAARVAALAPERFHLDVLERPAVEALGMGLYLGVALVSHHI